MAPPVRPCVAAVTVLSLAVGGCSWKDDSGGEGLLSPLTSAVSSLGGMSPEEAAAAAFDTGDADRRRDGIAALAASDFGGEPPYLKLYRLALGSTDGRPVAAAKPDPDPTVRAAAVSALGRHGEPADVALIVPRLADEGELVRWEAAKALQRLHKDAAAEPLIERVKNDPDDDVRTAAADALGQYAQPAVFDALVAALDDPSFGVALAARRSLDTLTGQTLGDRPKAWVAWAGAHRGEMFAGQRPYTYSPYTEPKSMLGKAKFWEDDDPTPPRRTPRGL